MKSKSVVAYLAWLTLALTPPLISAGCSGRPQEPLRIASSPWPGYEPLYLARDLGYLDTARVSLFELPSADITMESFRNHSTDLATLTLDETLELIHDGTPMRILLIMDVSNGADAVLAKPAVKGLKDIKGQRIAIVNIPLGLYMLSRTLETAGVSRQEVQVFPMAESKQAEFYRQGKADVVITFEPVKTRLLQQGAHVVFDSSQIPNEIFDLLVIHEAVFQKRRDEVCQVVRQWYRSLDYMEQNPDAAAQRIGKRLGVTAAEFTEMMNGIHLPTRSENTQMLGGDSPGLITPAQRLNQIMVQEKQLTRLVDAHVALDSGFAECHRQ